MRRQRCGNINDPAARMRYCNTPGEQMEFLLHPSRQLPVFLIEVFWVTDNRMAYMGHMGAQLVSAPGHRLERQPGQLLRRCLYHGVVGYRMHRVFLAVL